MHLFEPEWLVEVVRTISDECYDVDDACLTHAERDDDNRFHLMLRTTHQRLELPVSFAFELTPEMLIMLRNLLNGMIRDLRDKGQL